ncbi:MAG: cell envelope integrity protein TolA [Pseudomonadota bacterium]
MWFSLFVSGFLHVGLIGWAVVNFASTAPLKPPTPETVEVSIMSKRDEITRQKKGSISSKNLKTQQAKAVKKPKKPAKQPVRRAATPPPATPPPASVPAPPDPIAKKLASLSTPQPDPNAIAIRKAEDAKKKAEAEAKRKAEAEAKRKAAEEAKRKAEEAKRKAAEAARKRKAEAEKKRKAEAERRRKAARALKERERKKRLAEKRRREREARKKKQFDANRIAALLNKVPDAKSPPAGSERNARDRNLPRGPEAGTPDGRDDRLTASQLAMIGVMMRTAVKRCWNINSGLAGAERLAVEVELRLHPDGRLKGTPRVRNGRSDPHFTDAANSALRALVQCAPYDLPAKLYKGGWDHMVVSFDPSKMF